MFPFVPKPQSGEAVAAMLRVSIENYEKNLDEPQQFSVKKSISDAGDCLDPNDQAFLALLRKALYDGFQALLENLNNNQSERGRVGNHIQDVFTALITHAPTLIVGITPEQITSIMTLLAKEPLAIVEKRTDIWKTKNYICDAGTPGRIAAVALAVFATNNVPLETSFMRVYDILHSTNHGVIEKLAGGFVELRASAMEPEILQILHSKLPLLAAKVSAARPIPPTLFSDDKFII